MKSPARNHGLHQSYADHSDFTKKISAPLQGFVYNQVITGVMLFAAALAALIWANSPWSDAYHHFSELPIRFTFGPFSINETLHHVINDGLMAFFFFAVGLEIKHEVVSGALSNVKKALMPVIAALGGILLPALFYLGFNHGPQASGWAIPVATDIAFALGVLALFGNRIPLEGRIFLLTLATADDIGGILIIAFFYTGAVSVPALIAAAVTLAAIVLLRKMRVLSIPVYFLFGFFLWIAFYQSGIHAAISGVILGLMTPAHPWLRPEEFQKKSEEITRQMGEAIREKNSDETGVLLGRLEALTVLSESPLERLQRMVHPLVNFVALPLFALANSGVPLSSEALTQGFQSPVLWGIMTGLILGKPLGILGFSWLAVRFGIANLPANISWSRLTGIAILCGIGFTVSLFITNLAFTDQAVISQAKMGILLASFLAGVAGYIFLSLGLRGAKAAK